MNDLATKSAYTTASLTTLWGLTVNEWVAIIGALCAVGTFIVNWVYKRRYFNLQKLKLEREALDEK